MYKYLSVFTGIGGFDIPLLERSFECIGWSEIDKYAIEVFKMNFPEEANKNVGDITQIDCNELEDFDILVGGSPCQSFSISKRNRNGLEGKSGLFEHYVRILREKQPRWFIWENVRGVLSCNKGEDWKYICKAFGDAGYNFYWQLLNTKDYGVPQSRPRIYVVGQNKSYGDFYYTFPAKQELKIYLQDILEYGHVDRDYSLCLTASYKKATLKEYFDYRQRQLVFDKPYRIGQIGNGGQGERIYGINGTSVCLSANGGGRGAKTGLYAIPHAFTERRTEEAKRIRKEHMRKHGKDYSPRRGKELVPRTDGIMNCLTTRPTKESLLNDGITTRKLTPKECFRLQGFPDEFVDRAIENGISNAQLYKMAGNAVTVDVVRAVCNQLFDGLSYEQLDMFM